MQFDNELPKGFKTWLDLYLTLEKEHGFIGRKEISFHNLFDITTSVGGVSRLYRMEVSHIKAMCFDECVEYQLTNNEIEVITYALIDSRIITKGDILDTKLKKAYKATLYHV